MKLEYQKQEMEKLSRLVNGARLTWLPVESSTCRIVLFALLYFLTLSNPLYALNQALLQDMLAKMGECQAWGAKDDYVCMQACKSAYQSFSDYPEGYPDLVSECQSLHAQLAEEGSAESSALAAGEAQREEIELMALDCRQGRNRRCLAECNAALKNLADSDQVGQCRSLHAEHVLATSTPEELAQTRAERIAASADKVAYCKHFDDAPEGAISRLSSEQKLVKSCIRVCSHDYITSTEVQEGVIDDMLRNCEQVYGKVREVFAQ